MPLYEYECKKCHHRFERIQKFSDPHVKKCPKCGGPIEQVISAPAVQFKGSGWYVTDYAKKSSTGSAIIFFERRFGFQEGRQIEGRLLKIRKLLKVGEFKRKLERKLERELEERAPRRRSNVGASAPLVLPRVNCLPLRLTPAESFPGSSI